MKILFIVPYPLKQSPSQRFRFEHYFDLLTRHRIIYHVHTFLDSHNGSIFSGSGRIFQKAIILIKSFLKRLLLLIKAPRYDYIFIHREATPLGPPIVEWILASVFRKKLIYDFDDAIWLTDRSDESKIFKWLKWRKKVSQICAWAYKVSCGNEYLCDFARKYNTNVVYNPTTLETRTGHNPELFLKPKKDKVTIGWTGSYSTLKYLEMFDDVLVEICETIPNVEIVVIADRPPSFKKTHYRFIKWNAATEVEDLMQLDIGIMPLPDDEWSKGKCGFKGLQYMALGIPPVMSPVGVNTTIIQHGQNGFLADTKQEWTTIIAQLAVDESLRKTIGQHARQTVVKHYSVEATEELFLNLFK